MEPQQIDFFFLLPSELLVDILLLTNKRTIVHVAALNLAARQLFDRENGLWQQITCRIFHWGNREIKQLLQEHGGIDWKKEFRVTSFYDEKIRYNTMFSDERQHQATCLTKLADDHFKFKRELDDYEFDVLYFSMQSTTRLYPHPIGNFTVAYYEVDLLPSSPTAMVNVGAALEGYIDSLPGIGRNSFGYCNDGRVGLECELAPEDVPKVDVGDTMGFGINFENSSVFFTKNGKVVKEAREDYSKYPLLHLKALHATVGMVYDPEIKINFGAKPFKFDILKYQQQHCNSAKLQLYSQKMRDHVSADSMSDLLADFKKLNLKTTMSDYNIPKSSNISPFLYMINYMRQPPDWKGEPINPMIFQAMRLCQAIINSSSLLPSLGNSPISVAVVQHIASRMDFPYEGLSWEELTKKSIDQAYEWWFQHLLGIISLTVDHLNETLFENFWASGALGLHLFAHDLPTDHYAIQSAAACLSFLVHAEPASKRTYNFEEITELGLNAYQTMFSMRPMAALYASVDDAKEQLARQEKEAMQAYGPDEELELLFKNPGMFQLPKQALPLGYKKKFKPLFVASWEAFEGISGVVINGVYDLNIPIDKHDTLEEFLEEARSAVLKQLSTELFIEYIESCLEDLDNHTDEDLENKTGPIELFFGFKSNGSGSSAQGLKQRIRVHLTKALQLAKNPPGRLQWLKNKLNNRWIVGAGLALLGSVGFYWIRKKFMNE